MRAERRAAPKPARIPSGDRRTHSFVEGLQCLLARITVLVTYVHAQSSAVVSADRARAIVDAIPGARGPITMPRAHHHLMLDQPLALIGVLRAVLA